jgi:hypothetical protein
MNLNDSKPSNTNLEQLVQNLKNEDVRYSKLCKAIVFMYWILIPLYSILTITKYLENTDIRVLTGGFMEVTAFLIFALFFRMYYKEYKNVDYALPTLAMLKQAVYRYSPFQKRMVWIILAVFLINAGRSADSASMANFVFTQVMFWSLMALAVLAGLLVWKIKYKPLRDNALKLIAEIENS